MRKCFKEVITYRTAIKDLTLVIDGGWFINRGAGPATEYILIYSANLIFPINIT